MMQKDVELDQLTEAYYTKRIHSPRLQLSKQFETALNAEINQQIEQGVDPKRVLKAIEYMVASNESRLKHLKNTFNSQPEPQANLTPKKNGE